MTLETFENEIKDAIPRLLEIARSLTWNNISENHKFILTEIKDCSENFHEQRKINKQLNDKKNPVSLTELMPTLRQLYDDFYEINLQIYKATKGLTIIDFRFFPKSSIDQEYKEKILNRAPMLHCKVAHPPWLLDKNEKFDINWEHYEGLNRLRLFWLKLRLKTQ